MDFVVALVPSAGVLFLFVLAVRAMVHADRRERAAQAGPRATARTAGPQPGTGAGNATGPTAARSRSETAE